MRWLTRRGRAFYCVKDVPRDLRKALGRKRFVKSLHTRELHLAVARRHSALAEFEAEIARARAAGTGADLVALGMEWRQTLANAKSEDLNSETGLTFQFAQELEALEEERGEDVAELVSSVAAGRATPLCYYVDRWLAEGGVKGPLNERTKLQYRSDLGALEAWATSAGVSPTLEAFTRQLAGRYVSEAMVAAGIHRATANRHISAASAYWRWLVKRGIAQVNPWQGQSLSKVTRLDGEPSDKRPFTDSEARTLLASPADAELGDVMHMGALSGMRLEEIYRLTVADCADGWFNIRRSKTPAGRRRVPIHSGLSELVSRRSRGKRPEMAGLVATPFRDL